MIHDIRKHLNACLAFLDGATMQEIASELGVSHQRVQQILRRHGINRDHGGKTIRMFLDSEERFHKCAADAERRERSCLEKYGCTMTQWDMLRNMADDARKTPVGAFNQQKVNAKRRSIEWKLSLWEWWTIWQESGKWDERGRGGYCMARFNDDGPYSKENVYITSISENMKHMQEKRHGKQYSNWQDVHVAQ